MSKNGLTTLPSDNIEANEVLLIPLIKSGRLKITVAPRSDVGEKSAVAVLLRPVSCQQPGTFLRSLLATAGLLPPPCHQCANPEVIVDNSGHSRL